MLKRVCAAVAAAVALGAALPSQAQQSMLTSTGGRFGLGYDATLGLASGVSLRYGATDSLGLQAIMGARRVVASSDSSTSVDLALLVHYQLLRGNAARLSGYGGVNVLIRQPIVGMDRSLDTNLPIEAGLSFEYFATAWLSLHTQLGVVFLNYSTGPDDDDTNDITTIAIGVSDAVGGAGFTVWF